MCVLSAQIEKGIFFILVFGLRSSSAGTDGSLEWIAAAF